LQASKSKLTFYSPKRPGFPQGRLGSGFSLFHPPRRMGVRRIIGGSLSSSFGLFDGTIDFPLTLLRFLSPFPSSFSRFLFPLARSDCTGLEGEWEDQLEGEHSVKGQHVFFISAWPFLILCAVLRPPKDLWKSFAALRPGGMDPCFLMTRFAGFQVSFFLFSSARRALG